MTGRLTVSGPSATSVTASFMSSSSSGLTTIDYVLIGIVAAVAAITVVVALLRRRGHGPSGPGLPPPETHADNPPALLEPDAYDPIAAPGPYEEGLTAPS